MGTFFASMWGASVLYYLVAQDFTVPAYASPLTLILVLVALFLLPFQIFYFKARMWCLRILVSLRSP